MKKKNCLLLVLASLAIFAVIEIDILGYFLTPRYFLILAGKLRLPCMELLLLCEAV